jgi:hypothetical protein
MDVKTKFIEQRVLFQAQLSGYLSESYLKPNTPESFQDQIFNETHDLGRKLRNLK